MGPGHGDLPGNRRECTSSKGRGKGSISGKRGGQARRGELLGSLALAILHEGGAGQGLAPAGS